MNSSSSSPSAAVAAVLRRESWLVNSLDACLAAAALVGALVVAGLCRALRRHGRSLNPNVRVFIANLLLCTLVTCLAYLGVLANDLYKFASWRQQGGADLRSLMYAPLECRFLGAVQIVGTVGNLYALICVAIERMYATTHYKTYEKKTSPVLAILICIFQWSLTITALVAASYSNEIYTSNNKSSEVHHCLLKPFMFLIKVFCNILLGELIFIFNEREGQLWSSALWTRTAVSLLLEAGTLALFLVVWRRNSARRREDTSFASLAHRFQICQNISSSLALAKLVLFKTVWDLVTQALFRILYASSGSFLVFIAVTKCMYLFILCGAILQLYFVLGISRPMAMATPCYSRLQSCIHGNQVTTDLEHGCDVQAIYFQGLGAQWKKQGMNRTAGTRRNQKDASQRSKSLGSNNCTVVQLEVMSLD